MKDIRWFLAKYVCEVPEGLEKWNPPVWKKRLLVKILSTYPKESTLYQFKDALERDLEPQRTDTYWLSKTPEEREDAEFHYQMDKKLGKYGKTR